MSVRACLSASTWLSVAGGIFANASLVGAKIVMFSALLSVSTSPACCTAATSVDRGGLCAAAEAPGCSASAAGLPGPDVGRLAQAGPTGTAALSCDEAGAGAPASDCPAIVGAPERGHAAGGYTTP